MLKVGIASPKHSTSHKTSIDVQREREGEGEREREIERMMNRLGYITPNSMKIISVYKSLPEYSIC